MNIRIAGKGWVTPLGADLKDVFERLKNGDVAERKPLLFPESGRAHEYFPVPPKLVDSLGRNPRLRRASALSYFGAAAGLAALEDAGLAMTPEVAARTALVFSISDGGVQYTRRFFEQIVKGGAASPLLFPETVYNAPASHLAAQLGIEGATYTLVGDASIGLSALHFCVQLLHTLDIDRCLLVGTEECDWILSEAYRDWRLTRLPMAEGAAALLLDRSGPLTVQTHPGTPFFHQKDAAAALEKTVAALSPHRALPDLVVSGANGSFADRAETAVLDKWAPGVPVWSPKLQWGEAPGASALLAMVLAACALERGEATRVLVNAVGFNHQANAAFLET